ncbi:lysozyme [Seohaeicola zhoushanensis]|uniref:Lysozyme n=1 Tax=Seohaeicola zhoushanensis TaxID=1569283 RepID=A0A8J3H179_9RHOB|nr:lysozyme [Seohaeicola zhoushanensis]GHF71251.1 hypothetical protein GCM10017056_47710 [Seohaeicola zhoushanensis]
MKVSDKGLLEIAEHEGIVPAPYLDSKGIWTYGIGHTAGAGGLDPLELDRAMPSNVEAAIGHAISVFREDIAKVERRIEAVIRVPLKQHQIDAIASWDLNTGGLTWKSASGQPCQLVRQINAGDFSGEGFMGWQKPKEIIKRRKAERALFRTGNYDANGDDIPVWRTDGKGNLKGILRSFDGADLLALMNRNAPKAPPAREVPPRPAVTAPAIVLGAGVTALGAAWALACKIPFIAWLFSSCGN